MQHFCQGAPRTCKCIKTTSPLLHQFTIASLMGASVCVVHRDRGRGALRPELPAVSRPASSPRAAIWFSRRELGPAADIGEANRPTPLPPGPARSTRPRAVDPDPGPGVGRAGASAVDDGPSRHSHPTRVRDVRAGVCYPDFPGRRSVVRSKMFEHRRAAPPPNIRKDP